MATVALHRRRILLDDRPHLLLAGEVHYFRLDPDDWADRLRRLRDAGADTVATYIPWLWHELPDHSVDLHGRTHPQRDLAGFLDLAHRLGLRVVARPGPFVMAELKNEGIPHRVHEQAPHLLPTTWDGRPASTRTLDYLAPEFLTAADGWYAEVMPLLAERLAPRGGPVVAVQLDNEIGMLSWVTNSPDLTETVCADLRRWAVQRYGAAEADARFGAADARSWAAVLRHPPEQVSLAVDDDLGRYMRDRYRRYVLALRRSAERARDHRCPTDRQRPRHRRRAGADLPHRRQPAVRGVPRPAAADLGVGPVPGRPHRDQRGRPVRRERVHGGRARRRPTADLDGVRGGHRRLRRGPVGAPPARGGRAEDPALRRPGQPVGERLPLRRRAQPAAGGTRR